MSVKFRRKRKITDEDIIRLNSVGLSLGYIARELGCHTSSVTQRLASLGIAPADTRRTFMEDIFTAMPPAQQDWLQEQLGPHVSVKQFIRNLLVQAYLDHNPGSTHAP